MQTRQITKPSLPFPTRWMIDAWVGGRPLVHGILVIHSITATRVDGTVNFRGTSIPISGYWSEGTKQIIFHSPFATFSGDFTIYDEPSIGMRHFILRGILKMLPPSLQAGESGTWVATTDMTLNRA